MKYLFAIAALFVLAASDYKAQASADPRPLTFYRDGSGGISAQSRENAKTMHRISRKKGEVVLWITLDYPFNFYMDQLSQQEIDEQSAEVRQRLKEIINPLIRRGQVRHSLQGPRFWGPGCAIRAKPAGLRKLLSDTRLLQITAIEDATSVSNP